MDAQQNPRRVPNDFKFRVLITGRANAGKTTILERMGGTTQSPGVYRLIPGGNPEPVKLEPSTERGMHNIEDELVFTNYDGYIFHDSRGIESGSVDELKVVRKFVLRKMREKRLRDRLHAIWYCIPMDKVHWEKQDVKNFRDICRDTCVPVIAVFTKYDAFKRAVTMEPDEPGGRGKPPLDPERMFKNHYLKILTGSPLAPQRVFKNFYFKKPTASQFVRLEKMNKPSAQCEDLIKQTANALSGEAVPLMLMRVQRDNLELSINQAVRK